MPNRTKKHPQNSQIFPTCISDKFYAKSDQKTHAKYFLSRMVHMSYLRQNLEVSREFCDVPRKKKKL